MLSITLPDGLSKELLESKATEFGFTLNDFVLKAIELLQGFTPAVLEKVERLAFELDIPSSVVMQNLIIKFCSQEAAEQEVLGESMRIRSEFRTADGQVLTGDELFELLRQNFVHDLELKRLERIMEFKANDWELSDDDKQFLARHQQRK